MQFHARPILVATPASTPTATPNAGTWRRRYVAVLGWTFALFSSVRLVSYLPTLWAIASSGDSSQHSLWTWCTWFGSNLTMALWLAERNGDRCCRAALVSLGNATMCAAAVVLIVLCRVGAVA